MTSWYFESHSPCLLWRKRKRRRSGAAERCVNAGRTTWRRKSEVGDCATTMAFSSSSQMLGRRTLRRIRRTWWESQSVLLHPSMESPSGLVAALETQTLAEM